MASGGPSREFPICCNTSLLEHITHAVRSMASPFAPVWIRTFFPRPSNGSRKNSRNCGSPKWKSARSPMVERNLKSKPSVTTRWPNCPRSIACAASNAYSSPGRTSTHKRRTAFHGFRADAPPRGLSAFTIRFISIFCAKTLPRCAVGSFLLALKMTSSCEIKRYDFDDSNRAIGQRRFGRTRCRGGHCHRPLLEGSRVAWARRRGCRNLIC